MRNVTKNHHFVAQVEQRLNSINSDLSKKNQRIYTFDLINRENYVLNLTSENGERIENNLSFDDLFSFEILDEKHRLNLEQAFGVYEQNVGTLTESLLAKVKRNDGDIKEEILEIFALKLINSFGNPYCIKRTLNIIGQLSDYVPTDIKLNKLYVKIDNFSHPQWREIADRFSVSADDYKAWVKSLFMMLIPKTEDEINLLELLIKHFFESKESSISVFINEYSGTPDVHPLLSDRGFTYLTDDDKHITYKFNLSSTAFITYIFTNIKTSISNLMDAELVRKIISLNGRQPSEAKVVLISNNIEMLSRYNKRVVYQSHNKVFCKSKIVYGL